jgi:hypothetical protein
MYDYGCEKYYGKPKVERSIPEKVRIDAIRSEINEAMRKAGVN